MGRVAADLDRMHHLACGSRRCAVDEGGAATGFEHSERLAQKSIEVHKMMRSSPDCEEVEALVGEGNSTGVAHHPFGVGHASFGGDSARLVEHLASEVQPDHPAHKRR